MIYNFYIFNHFNKWCLTSVDIVLIENYNLIKEGVFKLFFKLVPHLFFISTFEQSDMFKPGENVYCMHAYMYCNNHLYLCGVPAF